MEKFHLEMVRHNYTYLGKEFIQYHKCLLLTVNSHRRIEVYMNHWIYDFPNSPLFNPSFPLKIEITCPKTSLRTAFHYWFVILSHFQDFPVLITKNWVCSARWVQKVKTILWQLKNSRSILTVDEFYIILFSIFCLWLKKKKEWLDAQ